MRTVEATYNGTRVVIVKILQDRKDLSLLAIFINRAGKLQAEDIENFTECILGE